jgi:hypothetical protein
MDPRGIAMEQMRQIAGISEKQVMLDKRTAALELGRVESEIAIARARLAVADAEIGKVTVQMAAVPDDAERARLEALIRAVTAERDARRVEVDSLTSLLEIKQKMAELKLGVDASMMAQVVSMMNSAIGGDSDGSSR